MDIRERIKTATSKPVVKNRIFPLLGAIIVFALCFVILYAGEDVGLSDNGDFRRVLMVNNLEYRNDADSAYLFKEDYRMITEGDTFSEKIASLWDTSNEKEIYSSPQFLLIKVSKTLNYISNIISGRSENAYSIIWLAFLYILMLSVAAWGIFTFFADYSTKIRIAVFAVFILMFCDAGYILYFNSFYGEPLQYTALMLLIAVGLLIYRRPSIPKVICFFIALYFFAGSKLANVPYSVMVCVLALTMLFLRKDKLFKIGVIAAFLVAVCSIAGLYSTVPDWMQKDTTYQSVFFGIAKESGRVEKDLKFLGVDEKYAPLANTTAYMDEDEYPMDITTKEFEHDFYDRVSRVKIAVFYVFHPVRLFKNLNAAISNSAYIRPPGAGNSLTVPMEMTNRWSLWSRLRTAVKFPFVPIVVLISFILITAYTVMVDIFYYRRRKDEPKQNIYMMASFNVLVLGLWINLVIPIIGNGEADIAQHMFLFTNCIDILIAVLIIADVNAKKRNLIIALTAAAALIAVCNFTAPKPSVKFGTYEGRPIEWEVYESLNDGTQILVTKKPVAYMPFDGSDNSWTESDLRIWLNTEFFDSFSDEERSRIYATTNAVILPYERKDEAVAGDHTHYWNFTRKYADDLSKTAYHYYVEDYVYIPTVDMLKNISGHKQYWVLCPYASNTTMGRFVNGDGFVLHSSVNNTKGVRAVIRRAAKSTGE